ncbi:EAL domain-containing protein [Telluria antibiotica]|nr:EAL domain-containing protein [Telluria antibiotica]
MGSKSPIMPGGAICRRLVLIIALLAYGLHADARTLRVVADNNYPPYLYVNSSGRPEGYLVDLWHLWEKKTGVHVDLQPMQWSNALRRMHDGQADVIDTIFRTPGREPLFDYSPPYDTVSVGIYVDPSISGIHDVQSMNGFLVGVQRGDACAEQLARQGITNQVPYPGYVAILDAVRAGDIKIFCMDDTPADYYLYLYRDQKKYAKAFTIYTAQFHRAVAKGDKATHDLVEQGMARITPEERQALRDKWFTQPIQFRPYLRIIAFVVLGALAALAATLLWIRSLRGAVHARTAEIQQKNAQLEASSRALMVEQAQLRTLVENSPDAMVLKDRNNVYVHCNAGAQALLGLPGDKVIGRTDAELFLDKAFAAFIKETDDDVLRTGQTRRYEEELAAPDGTMRNLDVIKVPIHAHEGEIAGVLAVARDITERRRAERELRIASVAFESQDGMLITDAQGRIERVNAAFTRISGYTALEAIGHSPRLLRSGLHEDDFYASMWSQLTTTGYWTGEVINRHRDGSLYTARLSITAVPDAQGRTIHYVGNLQDVTAEKRANALAEHLKLFDHLTDLPNRALLADRMTRAMADAAQEFGAVMMVNLDHFQKLNDSLGHAAGDQLLVEMARRIRSIMRDNDTLGRFSGDSFVLLTERLGADRHVAAARALQTADAIRATIAEPMILDGHRLTCTGSIGITLFRDATENPEALLCQAELALYQSKRSGRNTARIFEHEMQSELDDRNWLEKALRDAIRDHQLTLHYQIQVDAEDRPIGAEALLRWFHPERGAIPPDAFIPLAEETGLIEPIGRWVLATACGQIAAWSRQDAMRGLTLAVNISARQFESDSFVDDILSEIRRTGAPADKLKLEVTESLAIGDVQSSSRKLHTLRDNGFSISLDDFGTGNSSLNYLTKLPLTQLKIDKSFVDELPASHRDAMVAQTIINMGRGLGLDVIAEGVETAAQRDFLVAQGCYSFQGYLFGKPVPVGEFEAQVRAALAAAEAQ